MTRDDWKTVITTLFQNYDSTRDVTDGSDFDTVFVEPLLDLISVDDDADTEAFITDRLNQKYPELALTESGGALGDVLVKSPSVIFEAARRVLQQMRRERAGLYDPSVLTADSANDLAGNYFLSRITANYVTVTVRLFFSALTHVFLFLENRAKSSSGLSFVPAYVVEITEDALEENRQGSLYYYDALFMAERPGSGYFIGAGDIFTVEGVPGLVRATNVADATPARDDETPTDLATRVVDSVTDRSLVIARGTSTVVREEVPDVGEVLSIGYGDVGMERDVLRAVPRFSGTTVPSEIVGTYSAPAGIVEELVAGLPYSNRLFGLPFEPAIGDICSFLAADSFVVDVRDDGGTWGVATDIFVPKVIASVHAGSLAVTDGATLIHTISGSVASTSYGSLYGVLGSDLVLWWTSDYGTDGALLKGKQYALRYVEDGSLSVDVGLQVFYKGDGASVEDVPGEPLFAYVVVSGVFGWPTDEDVHLTLEDETAGGDWLEYAKSQKVLSFTPASVNPGDPITLTKIKVPRQALCGWADGDIVSSALRWMTDVDPTPIQLINAMGPFKWTVWTADYDGLMHVSGRGANNTYSAIAFALNPGIAGDTPWDKNIPELTDIDGVCVRRPVDSVPFDLTLSGVPGGFLFPADSPVIPNDSVHIGGKTDVYVFPRTPYGVIPETAISDLRDVDSVFEGDGLIWGRDITAAPSEWTQDVLAKVNPRCAAVMRWTDQVGGTGVYYPFRVVDVVNDQQVGGALAVADYVEPGQEDFSGTRHYLSSPYVTYDLKTPRVFRVSGDDLSTSSGSSKVLTNRKLNGVAAGDTLKITSAGLDKGEYAVVSANDYGEMVLERTLRSTRTGVSFEVYKKDTSFTFPVLRMETVTMDDGGGTAVVPAGKPLGVFALTDFQRGYGTARAYFQDRTFFYLPEWATFVQVGTDGVLTENRYRCVGPSTLYTQGVSSSDAEVANDPETPAIKVLKLGGLLHQSRAFLQGAKLYISRKPLVGTEVLSGDLYVSGLTLKMKVGTGAMRTLTFTGQNPLPVTLSAAPGGVLEQINRFFSGVTASLDSSDHLRLACNSPLEIGTGSANDELGVVNGWTNASSNLGTEFVIDDVLPWAVDSEANYNITRIRFSSGSLSDDGVAGMEFEIRHDGLCVMPTDMEEDDATGLVYCDFELQFRVDGDHEGNTSPPPIEGQEYLVRGSTLVLRQPEDGDSFYSDPVVYYGYHLATENESLAFSMDEELRLRVSAFFYGQTASDITQWTLLPAGNRVVTKYTYCPVTFYADKLLDDDFRQVTSSDLLAKAAVPVWVLGTIWYRRGDLPSAILPSVQSLIRSRPFNGYIDVSQVRSVFERFGAQDFIDPVGLYALVEQVDRSFRMVPFQDCYQVADQWHLVPDLDRLMAVRLT